MLMVQQVAEKIGVESVSIGGLDRVLEFTV
jgi:hypothetical protein